MGIESPKSEKPGAFKDTAHFDDGEPTVPRGRSAWFGGSNVRIGPRIGPVITGIPVDSETDDSSSAILGKQIALEEGCAIQYRTCSWQKVRHAQSLDHRCAVPGL